MEKDKEFKILGEILARLTTVRDGWQHKSKWNNSLGTSFLDIYIDDYKERVDKLLNKK